jgi:hypothetical protein
VRSYPPHRPPTPRRRPWLVALPLAIFVLLALAWTGFWFYAAHRAEVEIAHWREREAQQGRILGCSRQEIGGYPFRLEVHCADPDAELRRWQPALKLSAKDALVTVQVYDPTLVIGEFKGPLRIGEPGRPASMVADWTLAQTSFRGQPSAPRQLAVVLDNATLAHSEGGAPSTVASAEHVEVHGRIADGSATDHPVVDLGLRLTRGSAPGLQVLAQPTDGVAAATIYGLRDLSPKPWRDHLRELAQNGGRLEITQIRLTQGEIIVTGTGAVTLNANGRLDGQVKLTVAGLERLIALLGLDQAVAQYVAQRTGGMSVDKLASGLDRFLPGLGGAVRGQAGANLAAVGISMLGEQTQLDGRRAVALPLRFTDGAVFLGPVAIGQVAPLF